MSSGGGGSRRRSPGARTGVDTSGYTAPHAISEAKPESPNTPSRSLLVDRNTLPKRIAEDASTALAIIARDAAQPAGLGYAVTVT